MNRKTKVSSLVLAAALALTACSSIPKQQETACDLIDKHYSALQNYDFYAHSSREAVEFFGAKDTPFTSKSTVIPSATYEILEHSNYVSNQISAAIALSEMYNIEQSQLKEYWRDLAYDSGRASYACRQPNK